MLTARGDLPDELPKWKNRFYHAGLPQLQREQRTIHTRQSIRDRHPEVHELARAWRAGVAIVLPEVLHPIERRRPRDRRGRFRRMSTIPVPLHSVLSRVLAGG